MSKISKYLFVCDEVYPEIPVSNNRINGQDMEKVPL